MKISLNTRNIIIKRLLISLFIIIIVRIGSFLSLPGIDQKAINFYIKTLLIPQNIITSFSKNSPLLVNFFTLNIFPYINATLFAQLLFAVSPSLSKLRKEGSLASRRQITKKTRELTAVWAFIQGTGISLYFYQISQISNLNLDFLLFLKMSVWLTAGAMVILFLSDIITDYGLGNGPSLFVCTNIASNFPHLYQKLIYGDFKNLTNFSQYSFINLFFLVVILVIYLQLGETRINFKSSTQLESKLKKSDKDSIGFYIPLRLNQIGVMPIIFTTTILMLPDKIIKTTSFLPLFFLNGFYWLIYFVVLLQFSYFYSNINLKPKDLSDQLRERTSVVPGIRPGSQTTFYITTINKRSLFITALILSVLSAFPDIIEKLFNISDLNELSAVSLIIVIGVLVEVNREINDIIKTT